MPLTPDSDPILSDLLGSDPAPKKKAAASGSGMTQKSKDLVMRAIFQRDLATLKSLLDLPDSTPNFIAKKGSGEQSPLRFAVESNWPEGVEALLSKGASDSGELASHWAKHPQIKPAIRLAADHRLPSIFASIFAAETDPDLLALARRDALSYCPQSTIFLIETYGPESLLKLPPPEGSPRKDLFFESNALLSFLYQPSEAPNRVAAEKSLAALAQAFPQRARLFAAPLWSVALSHDCDLLASGLIRAGVGLGGSWTIPSLPKDLASRISYDESSLSMPKAARWKEDASNRWKRDGFPQRPLHPNALAIAAWHGSERCCALLARSPALREQALLSPDSLRLLAACRHRAALRALKAAGIDMSRVVDPDDGLNPLHRLCASRSTSKTALREMASVCSEWLLQADSEGRLPASFCGKDSELLAEIELISAKKACAAAPRRKPAALRAKSRRAL